MTEAQQQLHDQIIRDIDRYAFESDISLKETQEVLSGLALGVQRIYDEDNDAIFFTDEDEIDFGKALDGLINVILEQGTPRTAIMEALKYKYHRLRIK